MKRQIIISLLLLTFCGAESVFSQNKADKPNFAGTWNLNVSKSKFSIFDTMFANSKETICSSRLVITHNEPELKISEESECSFPKKPGIPPIVEKKSMTFFTDGRGENNVMGNKPVESKTEWKGKSLVITLLSIDARSGKKSSYLKMRYDLSKDRKTLTCKTDDPETIGSPAANPIDSRNKILVYNS